MIHISIHIHACVHPTASSDWTRRVQSVLVRHACVHHGQIRYPAKSFNYFEGKFRVYEACLRSPNCKHWMDPQGPFIACQASLHSPRPDLLLYLKLGMHLTSLRASSECMRLACLHPSASTEWTRRVHSLLVSFPFMLAFTQLQALNGPKVY